MAIPFTVNLDLTGDSPFGFLVDDKHIKGGYHVVATTTERDNLLITLPGRPPARVKFGMLVFTQDTNKLWQLGSDLTTWTEISIGGTGGGSGTLPIASDTVLGGVKIGPGLNIDPVSGILTATAIQVRQTITYTTNSINPNEFQDFTAIMGKTVTLLKVIMDQGYSQVQAFSTNGYNDTNPYTFVAVPTHLIDDGSTTLLDGTVVYGRRYTILSNLENPIVDNIYWRITNTGSIPQIYTITIDFIIME